MSRIYSAVVLLLSLAGGVIAQPLADRVPDDAMLYVGWAGAETLGEAYKGSNLKAILDNSKIRELFTQFIPQGAKKIIENEPDAEKPLTMLMTIAPSMWKHPHALFASIDFSNPDQPVPHIALICKAGADAPRVHQQITEILAEIGDTPIPVHDLKQDDLVGITIGYEEAEQALAGGRGSGPIGRSIAFMTALKQVQAHPALICYVDVEKLITQAEAAFLKSNAPEEVKEKVPKALDASGLRGLKRVIRSSAFDGKDWMSVTFVEVPAPRTGLLSAVDSEPVSPDLLKAIPADATFVATTRFDLAKLIQEIRTAAGAVDPRGQQFVDMGIGGVQVALAKNPLTDILEPMGQDWAMYCAPSVSGNGLLGLVVLNKLDDAAKAQAAYPTAWINLSNWAAIAMQQAEAEVEIRGRMTKIGDLNVFYAGLPIAAPAWTLKDGYLFAGLYPQSAAAGARALSKMGGKSISDNERFQALQKRLAVSNPVSFSFYDLPAIAGQGSMYGQLLMIARYGGFGDLFGVPMPEPLLPPLDVLQQHLGPAGSVAWIDDAGYHCKSVTPFPGAKLLSEPGMISSAGAPLFAALGMGIALPAMSQSREQAMRVHCSSNLRQIGQGILIYANDHQGSYPPDLGTLVKTVDMTAMAFDCPGGRTDLPDVSNMTPDQIADWINSNSSYVYIGQNLKNDAPAETIVVYEKPSEHNYAGMNILYADGHVEFQSIWNARDALAKQGVELDVTRQRR
jgi:prepilin-type processing-associated H-X9-DG protein